MNCIVDMDCRRHADQLGREAELADAVIKRQDELMQPGEEFDPLRPDNFDEAIGESLADPASGMPQTLASLLSDQNGPYIIARLLLAVATVYMAPLAELEVENDLLRGVAA